MTAHVRLTAGAPGFQATKKQIEANSILAGNATHTLLRGGSRSGKTFWLCRATAIRALKAKSTHAILRHRFNHLKASVINQTFPEVFRLCFPGLKVHLDKSDWFYEFPNGSQILFGGLDDKERTEKILGQEHSTIYLNECSQITYSARNMAMTRLAQKSGLKLRAFYDANPPTVGHWLFMLFMRGVDPKSKTPLPRPQDYATLQMNPDDNRKNLPDEYFGILESLPEKERRRFLKGEFLDEVEGALWTYDGLDKCRMGDAFMKPGDALHDSLSRVVVAIDPSGCEGKEDFRSDEIGIVVTGRNRKGEGFLMEDATGRYSPEQWARIAIDLFDKWKADAIIAERNYGGAMVESTIRSVKKNATVKVVTASRGKHVRAEPVASLYEQGKVFHVGVFPELEEQFCNFSGAGYQGARSPDRADAAIWGLTECVLGQTPYGMLAVA